MTGKPSQSGEPIRSRIVQVKTDSGRHPAESSANGTNEIAGTVPERSIDKTTRRVVGSIRQRIVEAVAEGEGSTPSEGNEILRSVNIVEAERKDVPTIMEIYNALLYDRKIFEELSDLEQRKNEKYLRARLKILASGGELYPISADEWERRIQEERVHLVKDQNDKIIGVNSYVFPNSEANRKKILDRLEQITLRDETHTRWFQEIEKSEARKVFMLNDTFFLREAGKGLLQETYRQMVEYEMYRNPEFISKDNLVDWFIYYWVNSFVNVYEEGKKSESEEFLFPAINRATVVSTVRAGGSIIGSTHPNEYKELILPDQKTGEDYLSITSGKRIILNRPYIDVMIPAANFLPAA